MSHRTWPRRRATLSCILGLALAALFTVLPACDLMETPAYSPDGKTIALAVADKVWRVDVATRQPTALALADGWKAGGATWFGDDLWVSASRDAGPLTDPTTGAPQRDPKTGQPIPDLQTRFAPVDLKTGQFRVVPIATSQRAHSVGDGLTEPRDIFIAAYRGRPALYVEADTPEPALDQGRRVYDIHRLGDYTKLDTLELAETLPAGHGWAVRQLSAAHDAANLTRDLVAIEVYDAAGQRASTIRAATLAPACYRQVRFPAYARVAADGSALLLAFTTDTIFRNHPRKYTFGVFHPRTGQRLWLGASDSMDGTPLVRADEVWTLEYVDRQVYTGKKTLAAAGSVTPDPPADKFRLVRHTPAPAPAADAPGASSVALTYALGDQSEVAAFAPAPDGSQFLVAVRGQRPRLLLVPIRPEVRAQDVVCIDLR